MVSKSEIRELFSIHDQASMRKLIESMETQIGEVVSDAQYRTVWMPCAPMEEERKRATGTEKDEGESSVHGETAETA